MSVQSKVIKINTDLFTTKNKTSKNHSNKNNKAIISSNNIKKKLINRIKEHKNKENKKKNISDPSNNNNKSFTDEFDDSINYMQNLVKKNNKNNNTIKNNKIFTHSIPNPPIPKPTINIDLPNSFDSPINHSINNLNIPLNSISNTIQNTNPISNTNTISHQSSKYTPPIDLPWGILKNGNKPTFRQWNKTQKHLMPNKKHNIIHPTSLSNNKNKDIPDNLSFRQNKLNLLKERFKENTIQDKINDNDNDNDNNTHNISIPNCDFIQNKKITKKNKYTVGKYKNKNKIGIILKNLYTRKNILSSQKLIKKTTIHDMKDYLFKHNIIKKGSNAPNDIIRKMYESSVLTGELINNSKDTLIHNLQDEH